MRLPRIAQDTEKFKQEIVSMGGINYSERYRDGDMRQSENLSARRWPYITTRRSREQQSGYSGVTALTAWGKLVAVRGTELLYDGKKVGTVTPGEKQFAMVNTKLVIWPDGVYLDLPTRKLKRFAASTVLSAGSVNFTSGSTFITNYERKKLDPPYSKNEEDPARGWDSWQLNGSGNYPYFRFFRAARRDKAGNWVYTDVKIDTLGGTSALPYFELDQYGMPNTRWGSGNFKTPHSSHYGEVVSREVYADHVTVEYYVHECYPENDDLSELFSPGDAITISCSRGNDRKDLVVTSVSKNSISFDGAGFSQGAGHGQITLSKKFPQMDFICESENRLWGCSSKDQTIYASALGDPTNFYDLRGDASGSFATPVGTEGDFTGCCKLGSSVLFWKETKLHKVLGSFPAEYSVYTYEMEGLKAGCHKSQQVINDTLYYMGVHGVYRYAGGTPSLISDCFGELALTDATAGTDGERYYLSAREEAGTDRHFLVYEPRLSIWVREDGTRAVDFARVGRKVYFADGDGKVWLTDSGRDDESMEWLCQFTPFYETAQGRKRYTKLLVRLELPRRSWVVAEMRCDGGPWRESGKTVGGENDVIALRLPVNRCDKFEIRLRGKGPCAILSVLREFTVKSDR